MQVQLLRNMFAGLHGCWTGASLGTVKTVNLEAGSSNQNELGAPDVS